MENLANIGLQEGIFAALFIAYFIYTQKINTKREERYIQTIEKNQDVILSLSSALESIDDIAQDVKAIKESTYKNIKAVDYV